ncbi:hypothetical protein MBLNU459_g3047t1 [Dothideomycetes sp. NU459]
MASPSKPVIVIATGAWHRPFHYTNLTEALEAEGYEVEIPHLASVDGVTDSMAEDAAVLRAPIEAAIRRNKDVVVVMHSYGGVCGSAAVKGLAKSGGGGGGGAAAGVVHMVYMCAFAIEEGVSLLDMCGGTPMDWWADANEKQWGVSAETAKNICYNDVDEALVPGLAEQCGLQSKSVFPSPQTYAAWKHIDSTYIVCEIDNAIPLPGQEAMVAQPGGRFVEVERLHAGHSPWISMPKETVAFIVKAAQRKA